jgi:transposase
MEKVALQQDPSLRADWIARIRHYTAEQIVCVDESAANSRTADRKYGWSPIGVPCHGVQELKREKRWSILPAYTIGGYLPGCLIHQGSINGEMFYDWIKDDVLPYCKPYPMPRSVIVMDNASTHRNSRIRELVESAGCRLEYLPPYSPDFNPIERSFHELKAYIKRHRQEVELFHNFGDFLALCIQRLTLFWGTARAHFRESMII